MSAQESIGYLTQQIKPYPRLGPCRLSTRLVFPGNDNPPPTQELERPADCANGCITRSGFSLVGSAAGKSLLREESPSMAYWLVNNKPLCCECIIGMGGRGETYKPEPPKPTASDIKAQALAQVESQRAEEERKRKDRPYIRTAAVTNALWDTLQLRPDDIGDGPSVITAGMEFILWPYGKRTADIFLHVVGPNFAGAPPLIQADKLLLQLRKRCACGEIGHYPVKDVRTLGIALTIPCPKCKGVDETGPTDREVRAQVVFDTYTRHHVGGRSIVLTHPEEHERSYLVDLTQSTCSCPDWNIMRPLLGPDFLCKHLIAAERTGL